MRSVVVEYGSPGHKGVTAIQGVGAAEIEKEPLETTVRRAGLISAGVWVAGLVMGSDTIKNIGFGGALASFGVTWLNR